jgi:flagellar hook-associated protein 1 FlgK
MGSGILSLGTRAMLANQAMLDTTSHNISNVNTPSYSRQEVQLKTEGGLFTGAGFYGRGVQVATVTRSTNEFLIRENNLNEAKSSADKARLDKLNQLEKVLPTGENGLGYAAQQVLNAFVDVANQPQDMSARQVVLARAQDWVSRVNTAGKQLDDLQAGTVSDMESTVSRINSLTQQIAAANQAIASYNGIGHEPNDLLDQRDQLLKQLNGLVQVNTLKADDGSVSVFMGGGQLLVLSNSAQTLSVVRDPIDSTQGRVALRTGATDRILESDQTTGGALKGLLQFQDNDIASTRASLNSFASQFANALNEQQSLGVDATGALQTSFDASGLPQGTPLFLNSASATSISLNLGQPKGLAAASPLVASVLPANTGTASIDSLTMARALPQANAPDFGSSLPTTGNALTVVFETSPTDPTQLTYRFTDSAGNPYKDTTPARAWTAGTPINDADPGSTPSSQLFNLSISGVPRAGDKITVARTTYPASNNGNAQAFLALRDKAVVTLDGASYATVTDAYSQMIGNLGVAVQGGKTAEGISSSLAKTSEQTLASATGVNLDEEAARLIQFQQSYQAAAKVLQIAQSLFDTLLQTARG